jgi:hypothetical protein
MQSRFLGIRAFVPLIVVAVLEAGRANAQVVQLPTFNSFGISTTVSVPDSGGAYLGGNSSSSMSRLERGLPGFGRMPFAGRQFGDRAIAGRSMTSGVSVSATIHDFEAMDEAVLEQGRTMTAQPMPLSRSPVLDNRSRGSANVARPALGRTALDQAGRASVADLRRQQSTAQSTVASEARQDYERGLALLAEGKTGTARIYFQRAVKRADPQLRAEVAAALRNLPSSGPLASAGANSKRPR